MEDEKTQQRSETDHQSFLPMDVWVEILLRIPAEDLVEVVMYVCKRWYQLINRDQSFARLHLDHWKTPRRRPFNESCGFAVHTNCTIDGFPMCSILYFTLHVNGEGLKFECPWFLVKEFDRRLSKENRLLASCDGLLLIGYPKGAKEYQLVVWNPITGSYRKLPVFQSSHGVMLRGYKWALVRNESTGQYKVFGMRIHPNSRRICHILELERAENEEQSKHNWKGLDAPLPVEWTIKSSTIREGKVYWLAWLSRPNEMKIVSIDIATDELRVSAPIELLPGMAFCIARNGAFCAVGPDEEDKECCLWGLENLDDNPSWAETKDRSIQHHPPPSEEFVMPGGVKLVINSWMNYGVMLEGTDVGGSTYLIHWDAQKAVRHVNSLIRFN